MPLFEYECRGCGDRFELLIRGEEKPKCPACGSGKLTKQLSVPAAHVAGGGKPGSFDTPCGREPGSCGKQCNLG